MADSTPNAPDSARPSGNPAAGTALERLARLEKQTHMLADEVLELVESAQTYPSPRSQPLGNQSSADWVWVDMAPDQALTRLGQLQDWMLRVLVHHPRVTVVLHPCWYRHPAVVQMLFDVWRGWEHAYRDGLDTPHRSLTWWQRDLPELERETARELGHCTSVRHDPDRIQIPLVDPARVFDTPR
ncbi:DUF4913 domain-containing protein [Nocardiopsis exhalans]|uniref:DUF4913 domain-containing protein n=1 Tax=Nocardiopsis exhalans TaxID=163604 RepID=A0ABY5DAD6_9ACTN|nr:DUF4913 domain-containing protein [Nocardiopsis exhalans]USY21316.1 DUF4913 domain-containing protein [Nocardiopsis exhalans]